MVSWLGARVTLTTTKTCPEPRVAAVTTRRRLWTTDIRGCLACDHGHHRCSRGTTCRLPYRAHGDHVGRTIDMCTCDHASSPVQISLRLLRVRRKGYQQSTESSLPTFLRRDHYHFSKVTSRARRTPHTCKKNLPMPAAAIAAQSRRMRTSARNTT